MKIGNNKIRATIILLMTVLCFSAFKNQVDEPEPSKGNKEEYMEKGVKEYLEG